MRCGSRPKSAAVPATVSDEPLPNATGHCCPGRRQKATTREPGDLPSTNDFPKPGGCPGRGAWVWNSSASLLKLNAAGEAAGYPADAVGRVDSATSRSSCAAPAAIETGSDADPRAGEAACRRGTRGGRRPHDISRRRGRMPRQLQAPAVAPRSCAIRRLELCVRRPRQPTAAPTSSPARSLFADSTDGLMPWRGRPDCLKRGLVARIPPSRPHRRTRS